MNLSKAEQVRVALRTVGEAGMAFDALQSATGMSPKMLAKCLADMRTQGMVQAVYVLLREPRPAATPTMRAHVNNGKTAKIRAVMRELGPADAAAIYGKCGFKVYRLLRRLVDTGYATATPDPSNPERLIYAVTEKVNPRDRVPDAPDDARERARQAKARYRARKRGEDVPLLIRAKGTRPANLPRPKKPKAERVPRIPKPKPIKPEQVRVKPSRRIKEDGAFAPAAMIQRPIDRAGLPDTDAFLRANPSALIRLKPGESSQPRERLTREQRQNILGLKVAVAA